MRFPPFIYLLITEPFNSRSLIKKTKIFLRKPDAWEAEYTNPVAKQTIGFSSLRMGCFQNSLHANNNNIMLISKPRTIIDPVSSAPDHKALHFFN
jgi:hypothetical protein